MENEREVMQKELMEKHPILDLVSFTELDIQEKLKDSAFLIVKYDDLYRREKMIYDSLVEKMESLVGMRYDYYRFELDKELSKVEIEKYYIPKDDKIRQMKKIMRKQMVRVEFFDMCVKGLKQQGWNMKVFSDNSRSGGI